MRLRLDLTLCRRANATLATVPFTSSTRDSNALVGFGVCRCPVSNLDRSAVRETAAQAAAECFRSRRQCRADHCATDESVASSGEQVPCSAVVADMLGSEKNRCVFLSPPSSRVGVNAPDSDRWQGQFRGQSWGQSPSRNPRCRLYLGFFRGEVAERLKAAVC
jgi:hypothetical protein